MKVPDNAPPGRVRLLFRLAAEVVMNVREQKANSSLYGLIWIVGAIVVWAKWELDGLSGSRVPLHSSRFSLLEYSLALAPPGGLHLEFGVYQGHSLNHLARLHPDRWFGFDSFEGLPSKWSPNCQKGVFNSHGVIPRVEDNVTLVPGWFSDTLPGFLASIRIQRVSFLHIDSDLYSSASLVLSSLSEELGAGTVIVFDEYVGILPDDEARAFREWTRKTGHRFVFMGCSPSGSVAVRIVS